MDSMIGKIST